jgi:hypothetical protein
MYFSDTIFLYYQSLIKQLTMIKLVLILACISICTFSCKQKTTHPDNPAQNEVAVTDIERCQSCAMPLTEDLYGTNEDGSLNSDYCKFCYAHGIFTAPDITMERMIEICVPYMVEQGMPEEQAHNILQKYLPTLKRWQTQE